jgi:hypothetical protein
MAVTVSSFAAAANGCRRFFGWNSDMGTNGRFRTAWLATGDDRLAERDASVELGYNRTYVR